VNALRRLEQGGIRFEPVAAGGIAWENSKPDGTNRCRFCKGGKNGLNIYL